MNGGKKLTPQKILNTKAYKNIEGGQFSEVVYKIDKGVSKNSNKQERYNERLRECQS